MIAIPPSHKADRENLRKGMPIEGELSTLSLPDEAPFVSNSSDDLSDLTYARSTAAVAEATAKEVMGGVVEGTVHQRDLRGF